MADDASERLYTGLATAYVCGVLPVARSRGLRLITSGTPDIVAVAMV